MKNMKKCFSILLALVMVFALSAVAMATDADTTGDGTNSGNEGGTGTTYTITISNDSKETHTYEAVQIFKGDLSTNDDGEKVLSNIVWGSGIDQTQLSNDYKDAAAIAEKLVQTKQAGDTAHVTLDEFIPNLKFTATTEGTCARSGSTYTITGLPAGYYLVRDQANSLSGKYDSYTNFIVQVVDNVTTTPKSDKPQVEKKVKDANDSTDTEETENEWQDSADHDIGDWVPFQITGTLPSNYDTYTEYSYKFTDTMSSGLTYDSTSDNGAHAVKVYVKNGETETDVTSSFTIESTGTTTITISCSDLKSIKNADSEPIVTSNSEIIVRYDAKLNENAVHGKDGNPNEVYLEYSNNPNQTGEGAPETGRTPTDKVIVFTYKTIVNKVDEDEQPLVGAAFTLEKVDPTQDGGWKTVKVYTVSTNESQNTSTFEFKGLDDGRYRLTETETPAGYNDIDPVYFVIEPTHITSADPDAIGDALTGLSAYITNDQWVKKTDTDGNINLGTINIQDGSITAKIKNLSGSVLPSTGGMGTTILYIAGGVLVAAAAVMLIMKRRMAAEK